MVGRYAISKCDQHQTNPQYTLMKEEIAHNFRDRHHWCLRSVLNHTANTHPIWHVVHSCIPGFEYQPVPHAVGVMVETPHLKPPGHWKQPNCLFAGSPTQKTQTNIHFENNTRYVSKLSSCSMLTGIHVQPITPTNQSESILSSPTTSELYLFSPSTEITTRYIHLKGYRGYCWSYLLCHHDQQYCDFFMQHFSNYHCRSNDWN